jgi:hypothetical protein
VPTVFQLRAKFLEVVDLTVEYTAHLSIFIEDWLMPTFNIDDAQAPHPYCELLVADFGFRISCFGKVSLLSTR